MTEDQIKHMVNRFLSWKFPESFNPDGGINFTQTRGIYGNGQMPVGTNLLDATQADAMVRHMLEGLPQSTANSDEVVAWCQPMDCGKHTPRKFMIYFDDPDHGIMVFDNEANARAAFERKNTAWNCYLFGSLPLLATPTPSDAITDVAAKYASVNSLLRREREAHQSTTARLANAEKKLARYERRKTTPPQAGDAERERIATTIAQETERFSRGANKGRFVVYLTPDDWDIIVAILTTRPSPAPAAVEALRALYLQALQSDVNSPANEWGMEALEMARTALDGSLAPRNDREGGTV
jgi:hypothetical protein